MEKTTPLILDGHAYAKEIIHHIKSELDLYKLQNKRAPGLAVILVGDNPSSITYVTNKENKCKELGYYSEVHKLSSETSEKDIINLIKELNKSKKIDGIIIQLPLPKHINQQNIIENLDPMKDTDGLHPENLGKLLSGKDCFQPCTPKGIIGILKYYNIDLTGKHAVVVGRSNLVGKPASLLLLKENCTVTMTHSKTKNIADLTKDADILICAIGKEKLVTKDWIKKDSVIIDVGINVIYENGKRKLTGDVDFESVAPICKAITPVPGGIGPVTVAMLMANTLEAYKRMIEE